MDDKIVWNHDVVEKHRASTQRIARATLVVAVLFSIGVGAQTAFYWKIGDTRNTVGSPFLGMAVLALIAVFMKVHSILRYREMRKLAPVTLTKEQIEIGNTIVRRSDVVRIETDHTKPRRITIIAREGVFRIRVPRSVSLADVKDMLAPAKIHDTGGDEMNPTHDPPRFGNQ